MPIVIFISYAHEDRGRAQKLAHLCEQEGWSVDGEANRFYTLTSGDDGKDADLRRMDYRRYPENRNYTFFLATKITD